MKDKSCVRNGPLLLINYLNKLVALQDHGSLEDQLTELQVVSESRRVDLTERHELLQGDGQNRLVEFQGTKEEEE